MLRRFFFILELMVVLLLCGCHNVLIDTDPIIAADLVKYNTEGSSDFGFNINLLTRNSSPDVEIVNFSGINTQGLNATYQNDTYDSLIDKKHNGYYLTIMGFVCHTGDDFVQINGAKLKIDGEIYEIQFSTPLIHKVKADEINNSDAVQVRNHPLIVSTNGIMETKLLFEYYCTEAVDVTDFAFSDFLIPINAELYLNGNYIGDLLSSLPINVEVGDVVSIKCSVSLLDSAQGSKYDSVYCDTILKYMQGDQAHNTRVGIVCQSVSNIEDAENVIDYLLE